MESMRTLKLRTGDTFAENELDPPAYLIADVWDGEVTILHRDNPFEDIRDVFREAYRIRQVRSRNAGQFDKRTQ